MTDTSPQMRRSISMPVKPQHLEPEILKRSHEKEIIFSQTDEDLSSDGENKSDTRNYVMQQRSTPALTTNYCDKEISTETELTAQNSEQHSLVTKSLRSVREFLNPLFTLFRRITIWNSTSPAEPQFKADENSENQNNLKSVCHKTNTADCMEQQQCDSGKVTGNDGNRIMANEENFTLTTESWNQSGHEKVTFSLT